MTHTIKSILVGESLRGMMIYEKVKLTRQASGY